VTAAFTHHSIIKLRVSSRFIATTSDKAFTVVVNAWSLDCRAPCIDHNSYGTLQPSMLTAAAALKATATPILLHTMRRGVGWGWVWGVGGWGAAAIKARAGLSRVGHTALCETSEPSSQLHGRCSPLAAVPSFAPSLVPSFCPSLPLFFIPPPLLGFNRLGTHHAMCP